jgi:hypothetical protein
VPLSRAQYEHHRLALSFTTDMDLGREATLGVS